MSLVRRINFIDPVDLRVDRNRVVHFLLTQWELEGGTPEPVLLAQVADGAVCAVSVADQVEQGINGKASGIFANLVGTYLTAKWTTGTTLTVASITGFSDEDPIAVSNDGVTWEYRLINGAPSGSSIVMNAALGSTKYKNAYVVNLAGRAFSHGRGYNRRPGVLEQLEAPSAPTIAVADGTGDTLDVTVTAVDEGAALYYDVYVRDAEFARIEPNWQPDLADQPDVSSALNLTTFNGGGDFAPDGTGGVLTSSKQVWVGVVAKKATGQTGNTESECSNIVEHTLD